MTRTADAHTALVDRARIARLREADERAFAAPFEAIQRKAKANRDAMLRTRRTWAYA